jgi:uncharacterized repeat protein (TIGR02059 family)
MKQKATLAVPADLAQKPAVQDLSSKGLVSSQKVAGPAITKADVQKSGPVKKSGKKPVDEEEVELAEDIGVGALPGVAAGASGAESGSAYGMLYASVGGGVVSDAGAGDSSQSAEPADTGGMSTGTMVGLGLVGLAGAATAIALGTSNSGSSSSSSANTSSAPVAPTLQTVTRVGTTVELTYDQNLDPANKPSASAFTVLNNGIAINVTGVSISGKVVTLDLDTALVSGSLTMTYTDPTAGDDVTAIQNLQGTDAVSFLRGIVIDGYIRGAQLYRDSNGDGVAQESEKLVGVVTGEDGSFILPNFDSNATGALIAVGGVNIDTGFVNQVQLAAPAGSTVINPLTTVIQQYILDKQAAGQTVTAENAAKAIADLFDINLDVGQSLLSYDPIANDDIDTQKIAVQIATLVQSVAADNTATAKAIFQALANSSTVINLGTSGGIAAMLGQLSGAGLLPSNPTA